MQVWRVLRQTLGSHAACVLVSVARGDGSTPREAGARMVVRPDGSLAGTIGGGHLEYQALHHALASLQAAEAETAHAEGRPFERRRFSLGPDLGQCCGGRVDLTFERFSRADLDAVSVLAEREAEETVFSTVMTVSEGRASARQMLEGASLAPGEGEGERGVLRDVTSGAPRDVREQSVTESFGEARQTLYLFGAGHVGRAVVLALAPLPFRIVWVDSRREMFPGRVPAHVTLLAPVDPVSVLASAEPGSFVLVMTHDHGLDEAIVAAALASNGGGNGKFSYIGLIGSQTKRKRFESRLRAGGLSAGALEALVCPIGSGRLRSKHPAVIAADVSVQLLERLEDLDSRRGSAASGAEGLAKMAGLGR